MDRESRHGSSIVAVAALAFLLAAPAASAQESGAVGGTVTDTTGLVLPGVTVDARSADSGDVRSTVTDGGGAFAFLDLTSGVYDVTFALAGFRPVILDGVAVGAGGDGNAGRRAGPGSRRTGGRGRQSRRAALGDRIAGPNRRRLVPGCGEPGCHDARLPVADPDPVVQRRHPPHQRRRHARPPGQPAQPGPRPHAGAGQRQAPPPVVGHRLVRGGHRRRPGARHLDHSRPSPCGRWRCSATARRRSTARTPSPA